MRWADMAPQVSAIGTVLSLQTCPRVVISRAPLGVFHPVVLQQECRFNRNGTHRVNLLKLATHQIVNVTHRVFCRNALPIMTGPYSIFAFGGRWPFPLAPTSAEARLTSDCPIHDFKP